MQFEVRREDNVIATGTKTLVPGMNHLGFRDSATASGVYEYELVITSPDDTITENNKARAMLSVEGPKPILHLYEGPSALCDKLRKGRLEVESVAADSLDPQLFTLSGLGRYSAVILENVAADRLGFSGMETLRDWVTQTGGGLMITGGRNSYAVGGYFKSPLDELFPRQHGTAKRAARGQGRHRRRPRSVGQYDRARRIRREDQDGSCQHRDIAGSRYAYPRL